MKVSDFKAVIISSSKTVESISTIIIKDDGTAVTHGFGRPYFHGPESTVRYLL